MDNAAQFWHFFLKQIIYLQLLSALCQLCVEGMLHQHKERHIPFDKTQQAETCFSEPNSLTQSRCLPSLKKKGGEKKKENYFKKKKGKERKIY